MATVGTLKTTILYDLSDISQNNYINDEIWIQFNKAISFISKELAKFNAKLGMLNTTATISASGNSSTLNSAFLSFARNEKGEPKVFNATNSYAAMSQALESNIDAWEQQDSTDTGTPSEFYTRGLNLYVHPWALVETTVKYFYHPLKTITNDASTMPWDSIFDDAIVQFVILSLEKRDERLNIVKLDSFLFDILKKDVMDILFQREGFSLRIASGFGWDQ